MMYFGVGAGCGVCARCCVGPVVGEVLGVDLFGGGVAAFDLLDLFDLSATTGDGDAVRPAWRIADT